MIDHDFTRLPALLVSIETGADGSGLVRFFAERHGALVARARGLSKPQSKLAPLLKPADELEIDLVRGRLRTPILTAVRLARDHGLWRRDLHHQALQWFMAECAYIGSAALQDNERVFQLVVNLLRFQPPAEELTSAGCAFCLKFLSLNGLLPDLRNCAVSGAELATGEPAFLLPTGEGLIALATFNDKYARTARGFVRLEPARLPRWRKYLAGGMLEFPRAGFDELDAAVLIGLTRLAIGNIAVQRVASAEFLLRQWGLKPLAELAVDREG